MGTLCQLLESIIGINLTLAQDCYSGPCSDPNQSALQSLGRATPNLHWIYTPVLRPEFRHPSQSQPQRSTCSELCPHSVLTPTAYRFPYFDPFYRSASFPLSLSQYGQQPPSQLPLE